MPIVEGAYRRGAQIAAKTPLTLHRNAHAPDSDAPTIAQPASTPAGLSSTSAGLSSTSAGLSAASCAGLLR
ncbi:hypothetical protein SV7mr_20790 [Stieleria bergensis]|uniref:Uncharacterized protein n=1 Tax=Stieleria bergensis TaxID=2528025 RepID=A0A517STY6_9BACT|nr:hypothetical protein SV7mr_20790 [Planctomycetes bacterium SV_7m_r]